MLEKYNELESDLIERCIAVSSWNKRMERYCGKEIDENGAKQCQIIVRSILSDLILIIWNNIKEGKMNNRVNDPVKDIMSLEEALINMDKKLDGAIKYIQSEEFINKVTKQIRDFIKKEEEVDPETQPKLGV